MLAADLWREFDVSADTIRRDLRELDRAGQVRRVHGGALPRQGDSSSFGARAARAPQAKTSIARRAAGLARDGQVILLDGGTTTLEVALALSPDLQAEVITNSLPVALALAEHEHVEVAVVGGGLRRRSRVTAGAVAVGALRSVRADLLFLGVCGLHPEIGVTVDDVEERHVKAAMIHGAAAVVGLADHDKLGTALSYVVASLSEITYLVTDAGAAAAALAPYRALGIEVLTA